MRGSLSARVNLADASIIIDLIQSSVLGTEVGEIIDVLATSDIRLGLRMTREFLQYGYTQTGNALAVYQATGKYQMPKHEALRAIMLGNQANYDSSHSIIGNPFDAKLAISEAQLLRLFILSALVNFSSRSGFTGILGTDIRENLRSVGFGDDATMQVLRNLCDLRFVQTTSHSPATFESAFIPSRLGGYIVRDLIGNFTFIENCLVDTFIADEKVWNSMRSTLGEIHAARDKIKRLNLRVSLARSFFKYMAQGFELLRNESIRRGLPAEWCGSPFSMIETSFEQNLSRAISSAQRNYGPSSQAIVVAD
jgi:hypothetical protein